MKNQTKTKIFLHDELKKFVVPLELRDNSIFDGGIITKGTRISLPNNAKIDNPTVNNVK